MKEREQATVNRQQAEQQNNNRRDACATKSIAGGDAYATEQHKTPSPRPSPRGRGEIAGTEAYATNHGGWLLNTKD